MALQPDFQIMNQAITNTAQAITHTPEAVTTELAKFPNVPTLEQGNAILNAIADLTAQMNARFDQMDQRIDQWFQRIDQRFEQIDQRFEQADQRFQQVDNQLDGLEAQLDQLQIQKARYVYPLVSQLFDVLNHF
jgi:flagellar capping protein FliD